MDEIPELDYDDEWAGYDIKQNKMVDFKEAGIIDPFKVTRSALQNASSIAGTILLTEATVVDKPSETNQPQIDPAMMGMM
jgi:chaperonin GroEL